MPSFHSAARRPCADVLAPVRRRGATLAAWITALAFGVAHAAEPVGALGAADRLVVRGLKTIPAERLRAGLLCDADLYWLGMPSVDRDAYLAALGRRSTLALEAAGFPEPRVSVAIESRADGAGVVVIDVVEGPRFVAGPIRVTGIPDALSARLVRYLQEPQPPFDSQPETIALPDGTTTVQWVWKDGTPVDLVEPAWKPGEPARHGEPGRESLRRRVGAFLRQEGFYELVGATDADADEVPATLREHVDVEVRHEGGQAALAVHVQRLPPRSVLAAVEIGVGQRTTRAELRSCLGLEIGRPVTENDRVTWREKLRQSGCFVSQDVTFTPQPGGVVARFDLVEWEHARPLDAPRSREEEALRRFRSWLLGEWHAGRQVRLRATRQPPHDAAGPPPGFDAVLGRDAGLVVAIRGAAAGYGCAVTRDGLGLFAPTARLETCLPAGFMPWLTMGVSIAVERDADGAMRQKKAVSMGGGLTNARQAMFPLHVEPVWCAAAAHAAKSHVEEDNLVLEFVGEATDGAGAERRSVMWLDQVTGAVRRALAGGWALEIETGDGLAEQASADLRAASGENLAGATRPVEALDRFLVASLDAFPSVIAGFIDVETLDHCMQECRAMAARIRRAVAGDTLEQLDAIVVKLCRDLASQPMTEPLPIPDDERPGEATTAAPTRDPVACALQLAGPAALRWLEERLGRDALPVAVARLAVLEYGLGAEAVREREIARLVGNGVLAEAIDGVARLLGDEHAAVARARTFLVCFGAGQELSAGRPAAAVAIFREALSQAEQTAGPAGQSTMSARFDYAMALAAAGDHAEALPFFEQVVDAGAAAGIDPARVTWAHFFLCLYFMNSEQYAKAIPHAEAFLARVEAGQADDTCRRDAPAIRESIGYCHGQLGDMPKSLAVYRALLAEADERHGPDHPETAKLLLNTIWLLNQTGDVAEAYALNRRPRTEIERCVTVGLELPVPARRKQPRVVGDATNPEDEKSEEGPLEGTRWSGLELPAVQLR